ncbi:MAG: peptidoglycan-binding protein [Candidatus Omnitrophica bacterium]|nr:peptidoglycan-binding protein [Candidatus Omnitrophota bacterium]
MLKVKWLCQLLIIIFAGVFLFGCATAGKKTTGEDLREQLSACEAQLREKDSEISNLRDALAAVIQEKEDLEKTRTVITTAKPSVIDIQTALKNAGFDPGKIDGKMGAKTREAIKAFQKANNLVVDGRVGSKTWALLSQYLEKKIK